MKSLLLAIIINELMASNVGTVMSPATNFDSWVEFYNTSEQDVDLSGMYLSNDGNDLTRWQMPAGVGTIPAKGYLVVWLGSNDIMFNQAPFKLDCDGGDLFLSDRNGEMVTSVSYPEAMSRTSWARKTDGGGEWGWTADATPGRSNAGAVFAEKRLASPVVSVGSRLFQQPFSFQVSIPKGARLLYTTDGTVPMTTEVNGTTEVSQQEGTWTECIKNGNCEGDDNTCFVCHDANGGGDVNRIVDGVGVNGSRGVRVHAIENAEHAYDAQFFVYTPDHIWQVGERFRFHMRVRADKEADISTEAHSTPHNYLNWDMLGNNYHITTEWQDITYEGIIKEQAGMQTIAFNLNVDKVENNYYFDDFSWESYTVPVTTPDVIVNTAKESKDGKFSVDKTKNYVFRLFQDGRLPSVPVTRSFIQTDREYTIPIVSIVGDERYFSDPMWGIDTKGQNGIPGNADDNEPKNWNQPWDRPVNFSYISPTEGMLFNQDVNISVSGGYTRSLDPRSMKLKSNKVFDGQNRFDYSFFPQKPYIRNKTLLLRNGGNDVWSHNARFMDPALTTIIQRSGIDLDVQSFVQVAEYINGKFKGVLNLREPNNDKFVYANWGYDDEEIDAFENGTFKNGDAEAYNRLCELAADINAPGVYDAVKQLLDVDEFANYMAAELYLGNNDWLDNNVKGYRSRNNGRFRFVCFDLDYAFNPWGEESFHKLQNKTGVKMVSLFLNLLKHDGFRRSFIDRYCIMAGSVFEKDRAAAIVDELADAMRPMSQFDGKLPDSSAKKIKEKLQNRVDEMTNQLKQYEPMMLRNVTQQSVVLTSDTPAASLYINGIEVPYGAFVGQLFPPVRLEAKAPVGYTFTGWKKSTGSTVRILKSNDTWKYYDKGEVTDDNWHGNSFNDASWSSGQAPLGYSMNGIKTTVSYGSDAERKNPTTYFRKTITLSETPTAGDVFQLNYQLDDGCIIWVNGKEAGRVNMRSGTVNYDHFSSTYAGSDPFTGTLNISPTLFHKGSNVIAVEVHNTSYTSSDLFWACELSTTVGGSKDEDIITEAAFDLPKDPTLVLKACFEPLTATERRQQGIPPVRINEVSADDGIYVNEYFKRKDWIELYNTTDAPVDVEGMYLSDTPEEKPKKYQISRGNTVASTIIPAHGHLVVWCDKESTQSQLHASFKLDAEGDELQLMAKDGSWTDRFIYAAHKSDQTVGRYPDGSNNVYVMNIPTIARANITSSYVIEVEQPYSDVTGIRETLAQDGDGRVYNLKGQAVLGTLRPGIYIRNGKKVVMK